MLLKTLPPPDSFLKRENLFRLYRNCRAPRALSKPALLTSTARSDLLSAGWLQPGTVLIPRRKKFADLAVTLLPDGRLDVQGVVYGRPNEAFKKRAQNYEPSGE